MHEMAYFMHKHCAMLNGGVSAPCTALPGASTLFGSAVLGCEARLGAAWLGTAQLGTAAWGRVVSQASSMCGFVSVALVAAHVVAAVAYERCKGCALRTSSQCSRK